MDLYKTTLSKLRCCHISHSALLWMRTNHRYYHLWFHITYECEHTHEILIRFRPNCTLAHKRSCVAAASLSNVHSSPVPIPTTFDDNITYSTNVLVCVCLYLLFYVCFYFLAGGLVGCLVNRLVAVGFIWKCDCSHQSEKTGWQQNKN